MIKFALLATLLGATPAAAEPLIFDNGRLFVQARLNGVPSFLITTDFKQRSIWLQPVKARN